MPFALILCPLAIEGQAVLRAVRKRERVHVRITGPGEHVLHGLRRALDELGEPALVILAGVCGGLRETERSPRVSRVVALSGASWDAPIVGAPDPAHRRTREPVTALGLHMAIAWC